MQTILINGVNSKLGGGASVLRNFLTVAANYSCSFEFVLVSGANSDPAPSAPNIRQVRLPRWQSQLAAYPLVYAQTLSRIAQRVGAHALLNFGDIPIRSRKRQVMLVDTPYFAYPESPVWNQLRATERLKNAVKILLFRQNLRYVDVVVAQTQVMRDRLVALYKLPKVAIVPNAVSIDHLTGGTPRDFALPSGTKLLCLTRYYTHKNIEILLPLARLIREGQLPIRLVTTIAADQHARAAEFLRSVSKERLDQVITNIGPVSMTELPSLYQQTDGLLLPTLMESFSGTYLEAMAQRVPILTSDLDFAHACCGDAAFYFNPLDEHDILQQIETMRSDPSLTARRVEAGTRRLATAATWETSASQLLTLLLGAPAAPIATTNALARGPSQS